MPAHYRPAGRAAAANHQVQVIDSRQHIGARPIAASWRWRRSSATPAHDPSAAEDTRYGALVAANRVAVYHDHYFSFRLDLDIDGQANRLVRDHLVVKELPEESARRSLWVLEPEVISKEGVADRYVKGRGAWRVVNANHRTQLGHNPSYQLFPAHRITSLLDPEDGPSKRAQFASHELWVTRYHPEERNAAGRYANQKVTSGGLPEFIADGEPIEDQDIVLWYTLGFHHITRSEDWPVLPTRWALQKILERGTPNSLEKISLIRPFA